jgi:excinuclease ABC subunit C
VNNKLKTEIDSLPNCPGVYQFFDQNHQLLYVGKAKNLQKRIESYWLNSNHTPWIKTMAQEVEAIEIVEVRSEFEALLLENSYIKTLRPKYNIQLRDDKSFPYLQVTNEQFPRFVITRKVKRDGSNYFGPYFSATYLRTLLKLAQLLYGIRTTNERSYESRSSVPPQIGLGVRNSGDAEHYCQQVKQAIAFLTSPQPQVEKALRSEMDHAAEEAQFERAAILRDRLQLLVQMREEQSLFSPHGKNRDYVAVVERASLVSVSILLERDGKIVGHKNFLFQSSTIVSPSERLAEIIEFIYIQGITFPQEIAIEFLPTNHNNLLSFLRRESGHTIELIIPKRGQNMKRFQLARENAMFQLQVETQKLMHSREALRELQRILSLPVSPSRIEACDISNLGSHEIVGASIVFIDGKPMKHEYRKYKILSSLGQDDFASMRDLVFRRISNKERPLPDLLLIDGGKGQLSAAKDAMRLAGRSVPYIALAKREEEIFLPGRTEPLKLDPSSPALLLLMAARDEVHRYVVQFHRQRRGKRFINSGRKQVK